MKDEKRRNDTIEQRRDKAIKEWSHVVSGTFYDLTDEEAFEQIRESILIAPTRLPDYWVDRRDDLAFLLSTYSAEELDQIVSDLFGRYPERYAGGGRAFLQALHDLIAEAIEEADRRFAT